MTALVQINQGTAPTGSDGDTTRAAFSKVNANSLVLGASVPIQLNYIGDSTVLDATYVGQRLGLLMTAAGKVVTLPKANTVTGYSAILLWNLSSYAVGVAGQGSDGTEITQMFPGDWIIYVSDGNAYWHVVQRGRNGLNETVGGNLTVNGTLTVSGGVTGNLSATGKISGVNNPNLQLNGSGEFASLGWSLTTFSAIQDTASGYGTYIGNPSAIAAGSASQQLAPVISVDASVPMVLSADVKNMGAAGTCRLQLTAWKSSGAYITDFISQVIPNGTNAARLSLLGTTPAGTAYVRANLYFSSDYAAPAFGVALRNIKVESGTTPSLYSQEASIANIQVAMPNLLINARGRVNTRTYASGTATTAAKQYTVDRWRVLTSGQSLSWTDDGYARTFTAPAGGVEQIVASSNVPGGSFCLSWTGTASATVNGTAVSNGGVVTLPVGTNASVVFSNGTFRLPNLQPGTYNSGVAFVDDDTERTRCLKYCRIIKADTEGWGGSSQNAIVPFNFDQMRTTPTGSLAYKTTPSYGGSVGSPPTWTFGDRFAQMTVALSATVGAWYVVGYDVLLDAEINT